MHGLPATTTRSRLLGAIEDTSTWALILAVVVLHIVLSIWQGWYVQINDDGITYIRAAQQFLNGDFAAARKTYGWFTFPLLIAAVSKITLLSPEVAGKTVNLFASTGTLALLLRMTWILTPSKLALCALAALVFGNYAWNDARGALTRDQLFIFFVVLSFFCLFLDHQFPKLAFKAGFAAACVSACLFRKEAAAFLVMVPMLLIVWGGAARWLRIAALSVLVLAAAGIAVAVAYQNTGDLSGLFKDPSNRMTILREQVLAPFASHRAVLAYHAMVAALIVSSTISSLGILQIVLNGWGAAKDRSFRHSFYLRLFICYLLVGLIALSAQTYFTLVFETRYGVFLGLLASVGAAAVAATLLPPTMLQHWPGKTAVALAAAWLIYGLIGGNKLSDSGRFNLDAAAWLRANVPSGAASLSNSNQINYYGSLPSPSPDPYFLLDTTTSSKNISTLRNYADYDVVVLRLRKNQLDQVPALDKVIGKKPSVQFENSRGDQILIYQPRKPAS